MTERKIGVGIIGAGPGRSWAAAAHIPALRTSRDFKVVALSTSRHETAQAAAAEFGVDHAFDNHQELLDCPAVDVVVVAVKVPRHLELVSAALKAGKHVYCEWPLGNGLEEAIELTHLASCSPGFAVVGLQTRSSPTIAYVRDLVRDGFVGRVLSTTLIGLGVGWAAYVDQANSYLADNRNGASMLTIPFGHSVDALTWVLGEFDALDASLGFLRTSTTVIETGATIPMTTADQIAVSGALQSGAVASIQYRAGIPRGTKLLWEIHGTEGDLRITSDGGHLGMFDVQLFGGRGDETGLTALPVPAEYSAAAAGVPAGWPVNVALTYEKLARDIREGTKLSATFADAVLRHRMIHAIELSAAGGGRQRYVV